MLFSFLLGGIALSGSVAIWFAYRKPQGPFFLFKPLTTLLILLVPLLGEGGPPLSRGLIAVGLGFSLVGDVILMLPKDRFLAGWGAFLAAHLCYITAFSAGLRELYWEPALIIFGLAAAGMYLLYRGLGSMKAPAYLYTAVISVMAWMAWSRWMGSASPRDLLAACGATLFMISDLILALDRFRGRFKAARGLDLLAYYAGQSLIALSAITLFGSI